LCEKATREWREEDYKSLTDTPAFKRFANAFKNNENKPLDLFSVDYESSGVIESIQKQLKNGTIESIFLIMEYLQDSVFPRHEIFVEQISNNPQNAASGVKSFQGYSGTLENPYIFHHSVVGNNNVVLDTGSNGRVIDVLLERNRTVHCETTEKIEAKTLLEKLLDKKSLEERNRFHALIDIGVLFKGFTNYSIASSLLDYFSNKPDSPIQCILYYDNNRNELAYITKGSKEPRFLSATDPDTIRSVTGFKLDETFTFYDHLHTTGSNIAQTDNASAIATFGESVTIRDILQGVMRMRKLLDTQNVEFVVPSTMHHYFEESLGIKIDQLSEAIDRVCLSDSTNLYNFNFFRFNSIESIKGQDRK